MLWELHEIRYKIACEKLSCEQINELGNKIGAEFQLKILSETEAIDKYTKPVKVTK